MVPVWAKEQPEEQYLNAMVAKGLVKVTMVWVPTVCSILYHSSPCDESLELTEQQGSEKKNYL